MTEKILIPAALLLFGLGMLAWALIEWRLALKSLAWPTVRDLIVDSKVHRHTRRYRWDWHVGYRYCVDGRHYKGWRVYYGSTVPISVARKIVRKFPAESTAAVYYDPLMPARSVLVPGANRYTYLGFLIGPICWSMALVFWSRL
jgi:hypothetical protein